MQTSPKETPAAHEAEPRHWAGAERRTSSTDQAAVAIVAAIGQAAGLYHKLLLVVGRPHSGKTEALASVRARTGAPIVNVGVHLARSLHELTPGQRPLRTQENFEAIVGSVNGAVTLLDNIEALFAADLQQDPLRLLQGVARNRIVVAAWPGTLRGGTLRYAEPPHREHREYPAHDLLTVAIGAKAA